ncbi:MAG: acyl-CoA dehydrogenase family protein [Haliea sp.]|nr:acyl-CoA dehydrogenase family protein [Haliea sp.]
MYFGFSDEQVMLRESVRRFLDQRCPLKEVRKLKVTPRGFSEDLWQKMAQAGWLGVALPEQYGGLGLGWLDLIVIIEEMGRSVFPSPFISNALAATAIHEFGNAQQKQQTLPGLIDGSRKATLGLFEESAAISVDSMRIKGDIQGDLLVLNGIKRTVMDPETAHYYVVSFRYGDNADDVGLALVDAAIRGVTGRAYPMLDETKRMGNLVLENVGISTDQILVMGAPAIAAIDRLVDQGALALTAEMAGAMDAALQITVKYAGSARNSAIPSGTSRR